jgi:hypothetical protein
MMSLTEFKQLNRARGFHWFEQATLRFFRSRVSNFDCISGLFISSERGPNGVRAYTLRRADFETGNVKTEGEFQAYSSLARAKTALRNAQRGK